MFEEEFGKLIRDCRMEKGLSTRKLSELIGLSSSYVSQLERGLIKKPTYDIAVKLAKALDISEDILLWFGFIPEDAEPLDESFDPETSEDEALVQLKHDRSVLFKEITDFCESAPYTAYSLLHYLNIFMGSQRNRNFLLELLERCDWLNEDSERAALIQYLDNMTSEKQKKGRR